MLRIWLRLYVINIQINLNTSNIIDTNGMACYIKSTRDRYQMYFNNNNIWYNNSV